MDHHPVKLDGPFAGRVQAAQNVHQRGFPAAGRSDNRNELAFLDVQRHVIQRADFLVAETINLADVSQFDQGHGDRG